MNKNKVRVGGATHTAADWLTELVVSLIFTLNVAPLTPPQRKTATC